jgi:hypothetical protein
MLVQSELHVNGGNMIRVLSCLLAAVVITTTVPVARADAPDDQFINSLAAQGITGDRGQLIADGHAAFDT